METGIKAWIANNGFEQGENTRIDLPAGWHWDISHDGTGYLKDPGGQLCVGYDKKNETIRFGADGVTKAPGLNLWTIQEMGEKFARENFMDDAAGREYDAFAAERGAKRREYEKGVRDEMRGIIRVELNAGEWVAHVDTRALKTTTGIESEPELTLEQGVSLFNKMSEARHVMPLRDPMGYMTMDGNVYDYIKEQYDFKYNDTIDNIYNGFINGNGRGCEAVLNKLDAVVRKNVREYCLPEGVKYQDLRHIAATDKLKDAVDEFVSQRVTKTVNFEKKRDHDAESLARDHERFLKAGEELTAKIADAAFPTMSAPLSQDSGLTIE